MGLNEALISVLPAVDDGQLSPCVGDQYKKNKLIEIVNTYDKYVSLRMSSNLPSHFCTGGLVSLKHHLQAGRVLLTC